MPARTVTIVIPDEKPISLNYLLARLHWTKRNTEVRRVLLIVRAHLDPNEDMFQGLVKVSVTVYFANKREQLDASNIPAKLYEDGLKGWLFPDDDSRYVRAVETVTLVDRENPRVELTVTEWRQSKNENS